MSILKGLTIIGAEANLLINWNDTIWCFRNVREQVSHPYKTENSVPMLRRRITLFTTILITSFKIITNTHKHIFHMYVVYIIMCYLLPHTKANNEELHNLYTSPSIIRIIRSRRVRWAGHVARIRHIGYWLESRKERDH
jgi:hypothetical protein